MYTQADIEKAKWLVENSRILNDEGKNLLLSFFEQGEPYPEEFLMAIQALIESEDIYVSEQIEEKEEKLIHLQDSLRQAEQKLQTKTEEISEKYPKFLAEEEQKTTEKIKEANEDFDQKAESIQGDVEKEQADAIRESLKQEKKDS